jgi:hypothetical protein
MSVNLGEEVDGYFRGKGANITVLEVASSSAREEDLFDMEVRWKTKLLSRKFGLNAN